MNRRISSLLGAFLLTFAAPVLAADPATLLVKVDQPGIKISPSLYGLMTEEINHSYDGGLYAELIQNRTFKDAQDPAHWSLIATAPSAGSISLDSKNPVNATLNTALRLDITSAAPNQPVGVANDGFWGIPAKANTTYQASFFARAAGITGPLTLTIQSNDGSKILATATLPAVADTWKHFSVSLKTGDLTPSTNNRFVISSTSTGTLWLNLVSLFPPTFNDRPNGFRPDLMQKLADMQPAFLRFPGGNYLEGNKIPERFDWKSTIGPLDQRPGHQGPWGYRSSDGMGLLEFLNWCEDIKMEPLLAVYAGYSLQQDRVAAGPALQPFVQDALDEIEYVTGDASTKWGQERIKDGHPAPFHLTYVEIGNEDGFDNVKGSYDRRFTQFFDAIRAKYPKLQLIATTPVASRKPDVVDDHYYRSARAMELDATHYDKADRNGPKIFVGEWATTEGTPTPTMNAALGDAAWMTGMERNSDLIAISCYAPLLVNVNPGAAQWGTNLIGYDALNSFASPSYYAQKMFAENRGDTILPVELTMPTTPEAKENAPHGAIGVGTWATASEYKDFKVTKPDGTVLYQPDFAKGTDGWQTPTGTWKAADGALQQSSNDTNCRATAGDGKWTDYTYTLKARKISGAEGFLVLFHVQDDDDYIWWNIGGWANTRTALEKAENGAKAEFGSASDFKVEDNRWYDLKVEVSGKSIKCFIDGQLITQATDEPQPGAPLLYATASRIDSTGEVILKIVNTQPTAQPLEINLQGMATVAASATGSVLSGQPKDVNTLAQPTKIAPQKVTLTDAAPKFTHELPPYSITVLRLKAK